MLLLVGTITMQPLLHQKDRAMTNKRKPKLLIIGHARHGKDTLAEKIRDRMGLAFTSSSLFVGQECIWPTWGCQRYSTFDEMFADRVNHRKTWADLISAYNTPDKTRTANTMLRRGYDMYVGMRRRDEFDACQEAELFNYVIWIDARQRKPLEGRDSMELTIYDAELYCDNHGPEKDLDSFVDELQNLFHSKGYRVGLDAECH